MQLDTEARVNTKNKSRFKKISPALAIASIELLGANEALAKDELDRWDFDTAILLYSEADDRVSAVEPVFSATRSFDNDESLNIKLAFDTLTGASPNGATPSKQKQIFTRPSGKGRYTISAGDSPLDDTFRDSRTALSFNWAAPINREWEYSTGLYGSKEFDYLSLGGNASIKHYFNQKNSAINVGLSFSSDQLDPKGGTPVALAEMAHKSDDDFKDLQKKSREDGSSSKTIQESMIGLTQIINRQTVMQFNVGFSYTSGYLTDPFKLVSVIESDKSNSDYGGNFQDANLNNIYIYEARPDSKLRQSFYWQTKYSLSNGDMIDSSYRFMTDDWGINSHTLDFRYRWYFAFSKERDSYLEPHLRYYSQSAADFYQRYIDSDDYQDGDPDFSFASADERLSEMSAVTLGLKYGWRYQEGKEVNVKLEYYTQSHSSKKGIGSLSNQELYPDTKAVMLSIGYSL